MDILQEETISATDDPYKYWGINCQQIPDFGAAAALKCLHMPHTSVGSVSDLDLSKAKTFSLSHNLTGVASIHGPFAASGGEKTQQFDTTFGLIYFFHS